MTERTKNLATLALVAVLGVLFAFAVPDAHASQPSRHTLQVRHAHARLVAERHHARAVLRAELDHAHARWVAAWTHIAVCEEGGWVGSSGYLFPNSLGITRTNWFHFGGGGDVRPWVQAKVAYRIQNPAPRTCPW